MSDYVKATNFASKDSLASGNPLKIVKGTEIDTEFNGIATAVATKADTASPTFTGTVTIPTVAISAGTITGITDLAVADGGTGASDAATARTNLSAAKSGSNSDITALSGLTTALSVAQGGTGSTTLTSNNVLLGNGTSALQLVAPGTAGNVLTSNGTTWVSGTAGVTSIATGNGLSGGTITTTGTLAIAAPTRGSVGAYAFAYNQSGVGISFGSTTAGSNLYIAYPSGCVNVYGSIGFSGTWRIESSHQGNGTTSANFGLWVRTA